MNRGLSNANGRGKISGYGLIILPHTARENFRFDFARIEGKIGVEIFLEIAMKVTEYTDIGHNHTADAYIISPAGKIVSKVVKKGQTHPNVFGDRDLESAIIQGRVCHGTGLASCIARSHVVSQRTLEYYAKKIAKQFNSPVYVFSYSDQLLGQV